MRRSSRLFLVGVLLAASVLGVSAPVTPVEAEERPVIVDFAQKNCV